MSCVLLRWIGRRAHFGAQSGPRQSLKVTQLVPAPQSSGMLWAPMHRTHFETASTLGFLHSSSHGVSQGDPASQTPCASAAAWIGAKSPSTRLAQQTVRTLQTPAQPASEVPPPEPGPPAAPPLGAPPLGAPPLGAPPLGAPPLGAPPLGAPPLPELAPDPALPPLALGPSLVLVELHARNPDARQVTTTARRNALTAREGTKATACAHVPRT